MADKVTASWELPNPDPYLAVCDANDELLTATCPIDPADVQLAEYENWEQFEKVRHQVCDVSDWGLTCEFIERGNVEALRLVDELSELTGVDAEAQAQKSLKKLSLYGDRVDEMRRAAKALPKGEDILDGGRCVAGYVFEFPDAPECLQYAPIPWENSALLMAKSQAAQPVHNEMEKVSPTGADDVSFMGVEGYQLIYAIYYKPLPVWDDKSNLWNEI